ncbi:MAG: hypothetical protein NVS4B12_04550 [Ktedonobacteraceae bacterium]
MYQYSWLVLFAPLLSFVVIVFGTRVWDMLSRPQKVRMVTHDEHGSHDVQGSEQEAHTGAELAYATVPGLASMAADRSSKDSLAHAEDRAAAEHGAHLDDSGEDDDEDPKVTHLSQGAIVSGFIGIGIMLLAAIYSWTLLFVSLGDTAFQNNGGVQVFVYDWFTQPGGAGNYTIAFHLDTLAIAMMVVVTTVSLLVHFYSQGYMEDSAGYARFYAYLALFTFSMLVIVFAENFLVIFVGWELVGLSSYLLIGFWINKRAKPDEQRPSPANAAVQAFVANRVGDVGFIIGIMILFANTGTFTFSTLFIKAPQVMSQGLLATAMILVFCGAIGKSAQVPLHVWLPSAMEGPTPVSALIHAATMVAAGVYMVARVFPLFVKAGPAALLTVAWVGGITALFAATIALVQSDFKRVLAFSTISQLGYMFVGLGISGLGTPEVYGTGPGMFHLFTHAFFKALLFLGAGSVLHSLHHATHKEVQDMRLMGGLGPRMPITAITWLIATLSISGFPFLAGFFSKETIIGLTAQRGQWALFIITLGTSGLTAFYMLRAFILAFGGPDGKLGGMWGGTYRGVGDPHESPRSMTIPLMLLAIPSVIAGYWFGFFPYISRNAEPLHVAELFTDPLTYLGIVVSLAGLVIAYFMYARLNPERLHNLVENNATLRTVHRILYNRYYVDDLYSLLIKYVVFGISHIEQAFDAYIVDGIVNGVARLVTTLGRDIRYTETGRVQSYMITFFGGVAVLVAVVLILVNYVAK